MGLRPRFLTAAQQNIAIRARFPQFKFRRGKKAYVWNGKLQPTEQSPFYDVIVESEYPIELSRPKVHILRPCISTDAPHVYTEGHLCLYHPREWGWVPTKFIASTIIPWTAEWLWFYEAWLLTGKWFGPSAPHDSTVAKSAS